MDWGAERWRQDGDAVRVHRKVALLRMFIRITIALVYF